jgi:ribosomal-protein-alanine N-acetyltransferase
MTDSLFHGRTVCLRPFEADDVPALMVYLNHPGLAGRRYIPWTFPELAPLSQKQVQEIVQQWGKAEKSLTLAIVHGASEALLGHAECDWSWDPHCPSLSVVIASEHQRQGYGSESVRLLLQYLFGHTPAHVISCWIADWNRPGLQCAARHGFLAAGRMRRAGLYQGRYFDAIVADLLRSEWKQQGGAFHAA